LKYEVEDEEMSVRSNVLEFERGVGGLERKGPGLSWRGKVTQKLLLPVKEGSLNTTERESSSNIVYST